MCMLLIPQNEIDTPGGKKPSHSSKLLRPFSVRHTEVVRAFKRLTRIGAKRSTPWLQIWYLVQLLALRLAVPVQTQTKHFISQPPHPCACNPILSNDSHIQISGLYPGALIKWLDRDGWQVLTMEMWMRAGLKVGYMKGHPYGEEEVDRIILSLVRVEGWSAEGWMWDDSRESWTIVWWKAHQIVEEGWLRENSWGQYDADRDGMSQELLCHDILI
ncbi:hypothetical protein IW262DRAFT_1302741 [Armillaria fumosa]|nr:hypothetical protein IW262DRAFT_1302741 [Armillaria fumosa]